MDKLVGDDIVKRLEAMGLKDDEGQPNTDIITMALDCEYANVTVDIHSLARMYLSSQSPSGTRTMDMYEFGSTKPIWRVEDYERRPIENILRTWDACKRTGAAGELWINLKTKAVTPAIYYDKFKK